MTVIDSHCHLDFPDFAAELDAVVARAQAAGVERMVTISTRVAHGAVYQALAERFADVYFTIGTHPHQAAEEPETDAAAIRRFAAHPKCVGVGEAGLDYHYNYAPREVETEGEAPGLSVFYKDERGDIFHTYSSYARGGDLLIGAYNYLDLTPKGRNETGPDRNLEGWVRRHDQYEAGAANGSIAT